MLIKSEQNKLMVLKKSTRSKRTWKTSLLVLFALVGVFVASFAILEITNTTHFLHKTSKSDTATEERQQANTKKEATVDNKGTPSSDKGSPAGQYTAPTTNNGITVTAHRSGDQVIVSTQLAGYSDGTCTLKIDNGSQSNVQTAQVIYAPSFSSCAGFVVPVSGLGSGNWQITLEVLSGGQTTSKTINYEV